MRRPFLRLGKPSGFLALCCGLAIYAALLVLAGSSALQARLAVCGIGVLLIGLGVLIPDSFWQEAEIEILRDILGVTATRVLVIAVGLGVIVWAFRVSLD